VVVDSFKFLPRSFRPLYEGRGPFPGDETPVWTPFEKRLGQSRIALLTSAGIYLKGSQPPFDLEREQTHPDWGDPSWRSIPASTKGVDIGVAHLHINDEDCWPILRSRCPNDCWSASPAKAKTWSVARSPSTSR